MNFLAHLLLSPNHPQIMLGNIVADFIPLRKITAANIQEGMQMHYFVDHFTDTHAVVKRSNQVFKKDFRFISGILVDIFYDHFLAIDFLNYSNGISLEEFCGQVDKNLKTHIKQLPALLPAAISKVIAPQRLLSYQSLLGMKEALQRINLRMKNPQFCICEDTAITCLVDNFESLQTDFHCFFADLIMATSSYRKNFTIFLKE